MTALVTGASGFVGSAVVRALIGRGFRVRAGVRRSSERGNLSDLDVEIVDLDLLDEATFSPALRGCEALFHVAADYRLWVPRPHVMYEANVEGTRALVRAACRGGISRIVYTSSVAVLGLKNGAVSDESSPSRLADMIGHYKRSKFLAEEAVRELALHEGAPVVIVNPSTPVGPRDIKPTPTGRLIVEAARGRMPAYVDTGLNIVHVEDVAEGHCLAFEKGRVGERYILGGENLSLRSILEIIAGIAAVRPPRLSLPVNLLLPVAMAMEARCRLFGGEPRATVSGVRMARKKMFFSSAKAESALGYRARPAREGLADAVAWFRAHGYLG